MEYHLSRTKKPVVSAEDRVPDEVTVHLKPRMFEQVVSTTTCSGNFSEYVESSLSYKTVLPIFLKAKRPTASVAMV